MSLTLEQIEILTALRDSELEKARDFRRWGMKSEAEWKSAVAVGISKSAKALGTELPEIKGGDNYCRPMS